MRAAPPVDYPLARHGPWDRVGSLLTMLATFAPVAWAAWQLHAARLLGEPAILALLLCGTLVATLAAATCWRAAGRRPALRLRWDGACWQLLGVTREPEELRAPAVRVDLGSVLLLQARRLPGGRASLYLPLERRDDPTAWHALRVAVAQAPASRAAVLGSLAVGVDA